MHVLLRQDGASIKNAETIKFSRAWNMSSVKVEKDSSFVDKIKALVKFTGVFDLEYGVRFVAHVSLDWLMISSTMPLIYAPNMTWSKYCHQE